MRIPTNDFKICNRLSIDLIMLHCYLLEGFCHFSLYCSSWPSSPYYHRKINNNKSGLVTLSPCHTLQNVIHTQKCVPCHEYAKPNRCVFKCFAKVSKPKEEDLEPTGKAFQLLGPATAKDLKPQSVRWLGTTMSPWAADLKADRPGTKDVLVQ